MLIAAALGTEGAEEIKKMRPVMALDSWYLLTKKERISRL